MLFGIDYGSKMAGTTVIAALNTAHQVVLYSSKKNQDADAMIMDHVNDLNPEQIGIDAPLSLPLAYRSAGDDFFYRSADRALNAMSPMFLGGLTARAMRLARLLTPPIIEVYPGALARALDFKSFDYKKKEAQYAKMLAELDWQVEYDRHPMNSHEMDAIIALFVTWKFKNNQAQTVGNPDEGLIYF